MKSSKTSRSIVLLFFAGLLLGACGSASPSAVATTSTIPAAQPTETPTATATATPTERPTATPTFVPERVSSERLLFQTDSSFVQGFSRLSPDSRRVAMVLNVGNQQSVVVNGIELEPYDSIAPGSITFSPDSQRLAYLASKDQKQFLVVDGSAGKGYDSVPYSDLTILFSPDNRHVAYVAKTGSKEVAVLDGNESKAYDQIVALAFNPADDAIAFWGKTGKQWFVVVDGKEVKSYDDIDVMYLYGGRVIGFSADGKHLAYRARAGGKEFLVVDGKEGKPYDELGLYTFAQDGSSVAYTARRQDKWFVVFNDQESQAYDLTDTPKFSPDGKHSIYFGKVGDKWTAVTDGLAGGMYDLLTGPSFSPDSQHSAFLAKAGDEWVVVVDGKEQRKYAGIVAKSMVFSPDSRHLAYAAVENGKGFVVVDGEEGPPRDDIGAPAFSPDGKHVAYPMQAGTKQFVVVDGEEGGAFDRVGGVYFDRNDSLHYLAVRGQRIYLVEDEFVTSADDLAAVRQTATAIANTNATLVALAAPTATARAEMNATAQAQRIATLTAAPTRTPVRQPTVPVSPPLATADANTASAALKRTEGWNPLLTDKFDDNQNGWTTGDGKSVANGKYVWDMNNRVNIYRGLPEMAPQSDFAASIDARLVSGSPDCGFGLTFRNSTDPGYMTDYVFYIHNDQRWGFDIIHSPDPGIAQNGTSDAIVPRALNRITVIAQGRYFKFFVNGKYVGQAEDGTLASGKVGAAVWILGPGACQVEFDNFEVRTPSAATSANVTATSQAVQANFAAAKKWPAVFTETFDSNVNGWPLKEPDASMHATAAIEVGAYRWSARPDDYSTLFETPEKRIAVADYYVSLEARRVSGPADSMYGLVFRESQSHNSLYAFLVNDEGKYELLLLKPGDEITTDLIESTESAAVRHGGTNRLSVIARGRHLSLFVNDQFVAGLDDDNLSSGGVGVIFDVMLGEDSVFEFDNLVVRAP